MTSETFVLLSGTLTFGVPIALAIRELLLLSPSRSGRDEPPPEPRFTRNPGPLPACLLPPPAPVRTPPLIRVLEEA